jgi:hypothetical protein
MTAADLSQHSAHADLIEHRMIVIEKTRGRDGLLVDKDRLAHLWRSQLAQFESLMLIVRGAARKKE